MTFFKRTLAPGNAVILTPHHNIKEHHDNSNRDEKETSAEH